MNSPEVWLLDVSAWSTQCHAVKSIEKVSLDFDDDFFLYKMKSLQYEIILIELWEQYEIHGTIPRKLLHYGNWTEISNRRKMDTKKRFEWYQF